MRHTVKMSDGSSVMIPKYDTHISKWVVQQGRLDHDQWLLPQLVKYLGDHVWDIGAYIGDHTIFYARNAPMVTAFEPNPLAHECLSYNLARYHNTSCLHMALSDKDAGVGVVSNPNLGASHVIDGIDAIPSRRADGLDLTSPTFIKMDAEGFEPRILDGAAQTIKGAKPVMLIEVNRGALARYGYTPDDIYSRVIDLGYSFRNIHEESGLNHEQLDILCLP